MKTGLIGIALCAALALMPSAASAGGHGYPKPPPKKYDIVSGLGTLNVDNKPATFFIYQAISNGDGTNPHGLVFFQSLNSKDRIVGEVRCLRVSGKKASILYEDVQGTYPTFPTRPGVGGRVFVEDGRMAFDSSGGQDAQRNGRFTPAGLAAALAEGCPDPNAPPAPLNPIGSGYIFVKDDYTTNGYTSWGHSWRD